MQQLADALVLERADGYGPQPQRYDPWSLVRDVPIASGCFMFARRDVLAEIGGFSPEYFLYFEDYDLSLRLRRRSEIAYVSRVRIVHHGGEAARKGYRHVRLFFASALRFFRTHGWKIA